jgi:hypothetical protein
MTITGTVIDAHGKPLAGIEVVAQPASPGASAVPAPCYTDENGNYAIDILAPGFFKLRFLGGQNSRGMWSAQWYGKDATEASAKIVPVGAAGVNAVLTPAGALQGKVKFPAGPAAFPVRVVAFAADRQISLAEAGANPVSAEPDKFGFGALPAGDYKLLVIPEASDMAGSAEYGPFWYGGAREWNSASVVQIVAGSTANIEIALPAASGEGSVFGEVRYDVDANEMAMLEIVSADNEQNVVASSAVSGSLYLGSLSRFALLGLPAGDYRLRCTLPGGQTIWYAEGAAGGAKDFSGATTITIGNREKAVKKIYFDALPLDASVSGRVLRPDGAAVAYQPVYAELLSGDHSVVSNSFHAWTDANGNYSGSLPAGRYRLCTIDWSSLKESCREPVELGASNTRVRVDVNAQ